MPSLRKILRSFQLESIQENFIQGLPRTILPVAPPEESFGWLSGATLNLGSALSGVQSVGTAIVSVTLPDDGFYAVDATCTIFVGTANSNRGVTLTLQDAGAVQQWNQIFQYFAPTTTSPAGIFVQPTIFVHMPKSGKVGLLVAVAMIAGDIVAGSIAVRKLYEEQM